MDRYKEFFRDKKVTLMGLGLLGRGIGDARFIAPLCKELIVTDLKSEAELASSLSELKSFRNVTYHLGGHKEEDFTNTDMVIKAAGVPLDSPYVAAARAAGVPVYMSTALAAKFAQEQGATVVGVTGTRGKSTVSALVHHCLPSSILAGNVRGKSTIELLPQIKAEDIVVLELDSWQLQGFGDLRLSPHIAVFTNLLEDHLNYYKGDVDAYFWDKAQIFLHQKSGDKLLVGEQALSRVQKAMPPVAPIVPPPLPKEWKLRLLGEHNRQNAALAVLALKILGLKDEEIKNGIESFEPVEGRLQFVREVRGVKIYNDNNSTTPEATVAALKSFSEPVILIAGGTDKNLNMQEFLHEIQKCKGVFWLEGSGTRTVNPSGVIYQSITDALLAAMKVAQAGDVILFSPAFASFGMFKNEYDRNDQFLKAVAELK